MNGFQITALLGGQRRFQQQADHGDDAVHRRADFVAHGRQKIRLGAHGGFGGDPGRHQLALMLEQVAKLPLDFQRRLQAGAEFRGVKRLAHTVVRAQFKRAQLAPPDRSRR